MTSFHVTPDVPLETPRQQVRRQGPVENLPLRHPGVLQSHQVQDRHRAHQPVPGGRMRTPDHQSGIPRQALQIRLRHGVG